MSEIDDILKTDPLYEAEKVTGKSYKESEQTTLLGMLIAMDHGERKKEMLQSRGDSYMSMTVEYYENLLEENGFKEAHCHSFTCPHYGTEQYFKVFYHPIHFCLLTFETFGKTSVNSTKMYSQVKTDNYSDDEEIIYGLMCSRSTEKDPDDPEKNIHILSHDCREGMLNYFNKIKNKMINWKFMPHVWFVDYAQEKEEDFDYKSISNSVIKTFPKEVLDRMPKDSYEYI